MLNLSSRWYLKVLGKSSEISDLPCLLLRSQRIYSVYVGNPHLVTSVHMTGPRGLLHMIWVWCLRVCHHGGYLPRRVFLHHVNIVGRVSTRLGLGLVHEICKDTNSNGHLWEAEWSTTHKKECKMGNLWSKFSHATQLPSGTLADYMYQNYGPENSNWPGLWPKITHMISSFLGQDVVPLKPQSSSTCSIRTKKIQYLPETMGSLFFFNW